MKHTQKQLEAMSDLQINEIVADYEGMFVQKEFGNRVGLTKSFREQYPSVVWSRPKDDSDCWAQFNYCNRWDDIGGLIDECSIDLQHDQLGNGMHFASDWDDVFVSSNPNIKRAAAIVYILIKQGEVM